MMGRDCLSGRGDKDIEFTGESMVRAEFARMALVLMVGTPMRAAICTLLIVINANST